MRYPYCGDTAWDSRYHNRLGSYDFRVAMQSAAQFTPEQLIVAGRRAEQQGQVGYALQFYRYLAEKYPNTAESFEARDALFRLNSAPEVHPSGPTQPNTQRANAHRTRPPTPAEQSPPPRSPQPELSVVSHDRAAAASTERASRRSTPRDVDTGPSYRTGRFVAAILSTLGWLLLLLSVVGAAGLAALLAIKGSPRALQEVAAANLLFAVAGLVGALFLGLLSVFAGQVARATFDNAEMTRWLASALSHDQHHE